MREEKPKKRQFRVYVMDKQHVMFVVDADSAEEARELVEGSDDARKEFGGKMLDSSEWYIDHVEEV